MHIGKFNTLFYINVIHICIWINACLYRSEVVRPLHRHQCLERPHIYLQSNNTNSLITTEKSLRVLAPVMQIWIHAYIYLWIHKWTEFKTPIASLTNSPFQVIRYYYMQSFIFQKTDSEDDIRTIFVGI